MLALAPTYGQAQQAAESGPKVGDMAPDFTLTGATRYGILRDQIKLEQYRGNTVVLAFFFKARTRG
jgi:peroxiredoxin Q/BCP